MLRPYAIVDLENRDAVGHCAVIACEESYFKENDTVYMQKQSPKPNESMHHVFMRVWGFFSVLWKSHPLTVSLEEH